MLKEYAKAEFINDYEISRDDRFCNIHYKDFIFKYPHGGRNMKYKLVLLKSFNNNFNLEIAVIGSNHARGKAILKDTDKVIKFMNNRFRYSSMEYDCIGIFKDITEYKKWLTKPFYLSISDMEFTSLTHCVESILDDFFIAKSYVERNIEIAEDNCCITKEEYESFKEVTFNENKEIYKDLDFSKWTLYNWGVLFRILNIVYANDTKYIIDLVSIITFICDYSDEMIFLLQKTWENSKDYKNNSTK